MTREEMKKLLESPVAKAFANGEAIEYQRNETTWVEFGDINGYELSMYPHRYRIKPGNPIHGREVLE